MTLPLHRYVKINGQYYAVQQSILRLAYYLYFKNQSLKKWSGFARHQIFRNLKKLFLIKHRRQPADTLSLPVYGHICLPIHQGYKVFNFKKQSVIKFFDRDLPQDSVASEIQHITQTDGLDFAPKILAYSLEERWFEEGLIQGAMGYAIPNSNSRGLMTFFETEILPILESMVLKKRPDYIPLEQIVERCLATIDDARISDRGLDIDKVGRLQKGILNITNRLKEEENRKICLVFSHGDFSFKNIMTTPQRTMVIDWEGIAFRSLFFDLYNWFFTELYYRRLSSNLVPEISKAVALFKGLLSHKAPGMISTLPPEDVVYRLLYYLERLAMLLQRDLNPALLEVILASYAVFASHEKNLGRTAI